VRMSILQDSSWHGSPRACVLCGWGRATGQHHAPMRSLPPVWGQGRVAGGVREVMHFAETQKVRGIASPEISRDPEYLLDMTETELESFFDGLERDFL